MTGLGAYIQREQERVCDVIAQALGDEDAALYCLLQRIDHIPLQLAMCEWARLRSLAGRPLMARTAAAACERLSALSPDPQTQLQAVLRVIARFGEAAARG